MMAALLHRRWIAALAAGSLGVDSGAALAQCTAAPGTLRAEGRATVVLFQPRLAPIKVGEMFTLDVVTCAKNADTNGEVRALAVDATMPEHKHGMNYQPVVKKNGANTFAATGLMFHMPGRWQFVFDIEMAAGRERVLHDLTIE